MVGILQGGEIFSAFVKYAHIRNAKKIEALLHENETSYAPIAVKEWVNAKKASMKGCDFSYSLKRLFGRCYFKICFPVHD